MMACAHTNETSLIINFKWKNDEPKNQRNNFILIHVLVSLG